MHEILQLLLEQFILLSTYLGLGMEYITLKSFKEKSPHVLTVQLLTQNHHFAWLYRESDKIVNLKEVTLKIENQIISLMAANRSAPII